jgi:transketolase
VEILSGSLGHGLPIATGIAQVGLERKKDWLVFCLLGDAELYEGSNWEAALFAAHKGLSNLVCIVDRNGQGVMGFTDDVEAPNDGPRLNPLDEKFAAFGFEVRVIDGHSYSQIFETFKDVRHRQGWQPLVVIANTRKGKGASIMENKRLWHYRVPTGQDLEITRGDLLR